MSDLLGLEHLPRAARVLALFPQSFIADFRPVPPDYYVARGPEYGLEREVLVCCPCGRRPVLRLGELEVCERTRAYLPTRAGCSRTYFHGHRLHVASPYVARAET